MTTQWLNKKTVILHILLPVVIAVIFFIVGYGIRGCSHEHDKVPVVDQKTGKIAFWTCSMHPQIKTQKPGDCPICGMDLIPVREGQEDKLSNRQIKMSDRAMKLAELETSVVERKFVEAEVRMVGKINYDETRLSHITAWIPGRLDRLFVDYTGIPVSKGDHLVEVYSPELLTAQEELLQAKKAAENDVTSDSIKNLEAVREKLRLWGLTPEQIEGIEDRGSAADHMTIYSPAGGIVVDKHAVEGMYVKTGMKIYTIADLSVVWAKLDAYESDLMWLRYGQEVEFTSEAYPGEVFKGQVAFIDPILDKKTRTVKVRVNVPNPEGKLKPQMFVSAVVRAKVATGGKVMDTALAGKWISPMHPEIIKDEPGKCDICGMPLVMAESLGYTAVDEAKTEAPLVIPASAVLLTGKRAVVYKVVKHRTGIFEGVEVELGPRAGDYYIVRKGLEEGDAVVSKGNFKIDSAIQILAKPSMMNPKGGGPAPGHAHHGTSAKATDTTEKQQKEFEKLEAPHEFLKQLDSVFIAYYRIQKTLSLDNLEKAKSSTKDVLEALEKVDMSLVKDKAHMAWMDDLASLKKSTEGIAGSSDITKARESFFLLSEALYSAAMKFGTSGMTPVYRLYCPMAFDDKGAHWLQNHKEVNNPYFGSTMFKCGELKETLSEGREKQEHGGH
ncbi:MAG: efflux RND transporter periplasmic adaptor subunit [Planctomycetota bacterium]|jgi:Cu(I)/Ag(I) efflux system membrane fusion protein